MHRVDVAVVGLGISGLVALNDLAGGGITTVGIDARPRIGGRTHRITTDSGFSFEAGGEFLKPAHTRIRALMATLGVPTLPMVFEGSPVTVEAGVRSEGGDAFADRPAARAEYRAAQALFADLAASVVVGAIHTTVDAAQLDSMSVSQWAATVAADPRVRERLVRDIVSGLGGPGADLSLLVALGYAAASLPVAGETVHPSERVAGGGFAIAEALAARLPVGSLALGSAATRVQLEDDGVQLTGPGLDVHAGSVILAMSPKLLRGIQFYPPLPAATASLIDGWQQAYGCKSFVVYPTPWWRDRGLSGLAMGDLPVRSVIDLSPADGSVGILLAETHPSSDPAANPTDEQQRALVLAGVAEYLGETSEPVLHFGAFSWPSDPLAGGCGSPLKPGLVTAFGDALGEPVGAIHFAGTETSDVGWGSMEGAVRAGQRAAAEVLATL